MSGDGPRRRRAFVARLFVCFSCFSASGVHEGGGTVLRFAQAAHRRSAPPASASSRPRPAPAALARLVGEYGDSRDTIVVLERSGRLYAHTRKRETALAVSQFDYVSGGPPSLRLGTVAYPRLAVGTDEGITFVVSPLRAVEELRAAALSATAPRDHGSTRVSDLVELAVLDTGIHLDIRYASTNNFLGAPMYSSARAFMQRPAAMAIVRAHRALSTYGYGLLIHDAYRPWYVTRMFWDATEGADHAFVADPAIGSRHNRGAAVDLTLYDLTTGLPARMTGGYDEFSSRSYASYPGGTSLERWLRDLLRNKMEAQGFRVNETEWWHFDYSHWKDYPILNVPFERVIKDS